MSIELHEVALSSRITITEEMIRTVNASNVLELGAGEYSFAYTSNGGKWTTADIAPPCDVLCDFSGQFSTLPFESNSFDLVICTEVLEHMLWPHKLLTEISRVLKPGGQLIASVPNISSLTYRVSWLLGRIPSCAASANLPPEFGSTTYVNTDGSTSGGHVIDFNEKRFEKLLKYSRFADIQIRGCGVFWHRQIIPHWMLPASLSSNLICVATKP